MILIIW